MSEFASQRVNIGAEALMEEAAAWIERRDREDWSQGDSLELKNWLAKSPAHTVAFLRTESAWKCADRLSALRSSYVVSDSVTHERIIAIAIKAVASLILAVGLGIAGLAYRSQTSEQTYSTPIGGHKIVTFADGSKIELNTGTHLRVAADAERRNVWLDRGEAYFQIKHDPLHPFIVKTGSYRVVDIGTKFLIRNRDDLLKVSVVEGRARLDSLNQQSRLRPTFLAAGDVIVATTNSISMTKSSTQNLMDALSWRHNMLIFKHAALTDATAEFNRYNTKQIIIADSSLAHVRVGGAFRVTDVNVFSRAVRDLLGLHVEERRNEVVISR